MSFFRSFLSAVLIATIAGHAFGQVVTRSQSYGESVQRSEIVSVSVEKRDSGSELMSTDLETKVALAIEDEFRLSGFLPALRTRPAGLIAAFYIEPVRDTPEETPFQDGTLVVECRDAESEQLIWRGVAAAMTGFTISDPYLYDRLTEAARMLVRRFNEERVTN